MIVIGIAGGIASGKSLVANQFAELGAVRLDADRAGHQVLRDEDVKHQIRGHFSEAVIGIDGEVDRAALAKIVFDPENGVAELKKLEEITHPRIRKILEEQIEAVRSSRCPAVVLDAPVMFKSGWKHFCDVIVFVAVPFGVRQRRAEMRGWPPGELQRREAAQISLDEKRRQSDYLIDNSQTIEQTFKQVQRIWNQLFKRSHGGEH